MKRKVKINSNIDFRHIRIRKKIRGTAEKPRLCVFRSLRHLEAQLVNDMDAKTVFFLSTKQKDFKSDLEGRGNVKAAVELGQAFAAQAKAKGFKNVVFDRGGCLYHGRIKAFADSARKAGLSF